MIHLRLRPIQNYVFSKHNIMPETQEQFIENVATNLVGIHSARLSTAYVALVSRAVKFEPKNLRENLYITRNLIKLRCMRKTLHILPFEIAPIAHTATLSFRITDCERLFQLLKISNSVISNLQCLLTEKFSERIFSSQEAEQIVSSQKAVELPVFEKKIFAKALVKYMWETGILCYVNTSDRWDSEKRYYAFTKLFYPELDLDLMSVYEAEYQLIYHHISKYGPVSLKDISWWSGLGVGKVRKHLSKMEGHHIVIRTFIESSSTEFYMTSEDYQSFVEHKAIEKKWVCLLAYEDPSLKGYFESRWRYVSDKYYSVLFNQIGEVRASVVAQGKVVGLWEWDKKVKKINVKLFEFLGNIEKALLQEQIEKMETTLQIDIPQ
jgi:hypothetical protein